MQKATARSGCPGFGIHSSAISGNASSANGSTSRVAFTVRARGGRSNRTRLSSVFSTHFVEQRRSEHDSVPCLPFACALLATQCVSSSALRLRVGSHRKQGTNAASGVLTDSHRKYSRHTRPRSRNSPEPSWSAKVCTSLDAASYVCRRGPEMYT